MDYRKIRKEALSTRWELARGIALGVALAWSLQSFGAPARAATVVTALVPQAYTTSSFPFTSGGTHTLTNEDNTTVTFTIPENYFSQMLEFYTFAYPNTVFQDSKPPSSGKNFVGEVYDFQWFSMSGTQISTTSLDITISFTYQDSDVSGIDESTLRPYRWNAGSESWTMLSGSSIDTANNRVTVSTKNFSSFSLLGDPAPAPSPAVVVSGGGGGGGWSPPPPPPSATIIFEGRAYPRSTVTLLKDAQVAATAIAGPDAKFSLTLSGLSGGSYIFSVYSEDSKGYRSSLFAFPVSVISEATVKTSGIFIAPTIAVEKSEVKRGDNIAIFGQSAPSADIVISVNSEEEFFTKTISDKDGIYLYNFDTTQLDMGQHFTKSKAALAGVISSFGKVIGFTVGTKNVLAQLPIKAPAKGDLNGDKKVNLVDFSIVAYWYKRLSPPATADLNGDKKVDLIDFSIMAFYWTG